MNDMAWAQLHRLQEAGIIVFNPLHNRDEVRRIAKEKSCNELYDWIMEHTQGEYSKALSHGKA